MRSNKNPHAAELAEGWEGKHGSRLGPELYPAPLAVKHLDAFQMRIWIRSAADVTNHNLPPLEDNRAAIMHAGKI